VTVAQYRVFAKDSGRKPDEAWEKSNRYDNHPVVEVTWYDAVAYCRWLTAKFHEHGFDYIVQLPSEAQWEKAARGADGRIYPWGDTIDATRANYGETGIGTTSPAGCFSKDKSPYGTMDMAGNVWEWTSSIWGKEFSKPDFKYPYDPSDGREDDSSDAYRVLRGGSWYISARLCRAASRYGLNPGNRGDYYGFRLVLLPGQEKESQ